MREKYRSKASKSVSTFAQILWDYHHVNHSICPMDCILVLGSNDTRVAERGAELYLEGYAPLLVYSGGLGNFTKGNWEEPEADKFTKIAISMGVPSSKILIENRSTNTGENLRLTKKLFDAEGIDPQRFILVQKPFMERRSLATFEKEWPDKEVRVTSPLLSLQDYPNEEISFKLLVNAMVGDLQRIKLYPEKGFQTYQEIPGEVWEAYLALIDMGYDKHLIGE
ncbi:YdcF family protein [Pleomorphovibrio marinus]|uniref:YdcF family protein n=1 Tax=Pleomorphovibrio marinus TaxID=2164132 RepID=UPI000E0B925B|nr:YdcF family protein [Pleomorphovibrio marinus]